jgi:hypothetical protein
VRSISVRSKLQGGQTVGVVAGKKTKTFQTIDIICQWQYFIAHCFSFHVGNDFGLPSTLKLLM